jgi:hypothetical protein
MDVREGMRRLGGAASTHFTTKDVGEFAVDGLARGLCKEIGNADPSILILGTLEVCDDGGETGGNNGLKGH